MSLPTCPESFTSHRHAAAWLIEWTTKKGPRAGCVNCEWFRRKTDAEDRLSRLKKGGFECSMSKDEDYNGPL